MSKEVTTCKQADFEAEDNQGPKCTLGSDAERNELSSLSYLSQAKIQAYDQLKPNDVQTNDKDISFMKIGSAEVQQDTVSIE